MVEKAVELSDKDRREQMRHELESYQKRQPWREKQTGTAEQGGETEGGVPKSTAADEKKK